MQLDYIEQRLAPPVLLQQIRNQLILYAEIRPKQPLQRSVDCDQATPGRQVENAQCASHIEAK